MPTNAENDRLGLLRGTDWTQLPDVPLTDEERQIWSVYRQELRDASSQPIWPDSWTPPALPVFNTPEPIEEPAAEPAAEPVPSGGGA